MKRKFHNLRKAAILLPLSLGFMALCCKRDEIKPPVFENKPEVVYPDSLAGEMKVTFAHNVDGKALVFETTQYENASGNAYKVITLKYYISNLKLKNTLTGNTYAVPNSYYLINPKEGKTNLDLKGIPVKEFNQLEFSIGVDPATNASSDHTGDLDPINDMFWSWQTSYKFLQFDGYFNNSGLSFHIGTDQNYKTLNFPLSQTLSFQKNKPYTLQIGVNLNELFRNPNQIDFNTTYNVTDGPDAKKLADNYATGMFTVQKITQ